MIAQILAELDAIVEAAEESGEKRVDTLTWKTYRVSPESSEGLAKVLPEIIAPKAGRPVHVKDISKAKAKFAADQDSC